MTKKDLIEQLQPFPENMEVFIQQREDDFDISPIEKVEMKLANFYEDTGGKIMAKDNIIILSDFE